MMRIMPVRTLAQGGATPPVQAPIPIGGIPVQSPMIQQGMDLANWVQENILKPNLLNNLTPKQQVSSGGGLPPGVAGYIKRRPTISQRLSNFYGQLALRRAQVNADLELQRKQWEEQFRQYTARRKFDEDMDAKRRREERQWLENQWNKFYSIIKDVYSTQSNIGQTGFAQSNNILNNLWGSLQPKAQQPLTQPSKYQQPQPNPMNTVLGSSRRVLK